MDRALPTAEKLSVAPVGNGQNFSHDGDCYFQGRFSAEVEANREVPTFNNLWIDMTAFIGQLAEQSFGAPPWTQQADIARPNLG